MKVRHFARPGSKPVKVSGDAPALITNLKAQGFEECEAPAPEPKQGKRQSYYYTPVMAGR